MGGCSNGSSEGEGSLGKGKSGTESTGAHPGGSSTAGVYSGTDSSVYELSSDDLMAPESDFGGSVNEPIEKGDFPSSDVFCGRSSEGLTLPERIFALHRFPSDGRVNSYSKMQHLIDMVDVLSGRMEFNVIMGSQFGHLFRLPLSHCSLSGKLVHNMLCRQLVSQNKHDAWFAFGRYPLRFSILEFEKVTGLNCGPVPDIRRSCSRKDRKGQTKPYWDTLIGAERSITIVDLVAKLKAEPDMPGWRLLRLVLVVIVDGILLCGTQPVSASADVVEMVRDVPAFLKYPWGRRSFELTLRMMKVGTRITSKEELVTKLKQISVALHGFPLALQLVLFEAIPSLRSYLPRSDCAENFLDRTVTELPRLTTYHTDNILQIELDPKLSVVCRLARESSPYPVDRPSDRHVAYLEHLLDRDECFTPESWVGGDSSLSPLCICKTNKDGRCTCVKVSSVNGCESLEKLESAGQPREDCGRCLELEEAVKRIQASMLEFEKKLPVVINTEVGKMRQLIVEDVMKQMRVNCDRTLDGNTTKTGECEWDTKKAYVGMDSISSADTRKEDYLPDTIPKADVSSILGFVNKNLPPNGQPYEEGRKDRETVDAEVPHPDPDILWTANALDMDSKPLPLRKDIDLPRASSRRKRDLQCKVDVCAVGRQLRRQTRARNQTTPGVPELHQDTENENRRKRGKASAEDDAEQLRAAAFIVQPPDVVQKFTAILKAYKKRVYDLDGLLVEKNFFTQILTPSEWLTNTHLDLIIRSVWSRRGKGLLCRGITITDCYFTQYLAGNWKAFTSAGEGAFKWPSSLQSYVHGVLPRRDVVSPWAKDVHTIYAPMNWGCRHWVALVINLHTWHIQVLDPLCSATPKWKVRKYMEPIINMLPPLLRCFCEPQTTFELHDKPFTYTRDTGLSENERTGDCGPLSVKFIELHSQSLDLTGISEEMVDQIRMSFAVDVYSDFVRVVE